MSDESMRKAGRAELDRLNASSKPAATAKKKRPQVETSYKDLMGIGKKKTLRSVDDYMKKAIDEAPNP